MGHTDGAEALTIILLIIGVLALAGAAWRAWLRDLPAAAALLIVGVIVLILAL